MLLDSHAAQAAAVALAGCLALAGFAAPAAFAVAGNNGTIKIDDVEFDDHPHNEPHVGCTFQVDFYGYDEGDLDANGDLQDAAAYPRRSARSYCTDTCSLVRTTTPAAAAELG